MLENNMIEVDVVETWWDYLLGCATIVLAIINVILIYIIYKWQHKDSAVIEEKQRRVNQFNNIFLIPRMDYLKKTFDHLIKISLEFDKAKDNDDEKSKTSDKIDNKIKEFDDKFVSFISGIDSNLHEKVHRIVEDMRDGLSHDIFDTDTDKIKGGIYVQIIQKRINASYKTLLTALFSYDGTTKDNTEKSDKGLGIWIYILLGVIVILLGTLVFHNYTTPAQDKVTIQLDSTQMRSLIDAVHNDSITK